MEFCKPVNREQFIHAFNQVPETVFRMKGVIEFEETNKPTLIQFVAVRYEFFEFDKTLNGSGFWVVIGQNLPIRLFSDYF